MPYVDPARRSAASFSPANVGELTYKIQQLLQSYLAKNGLRYQQLAECLGALDGARADFIDRVLLPYERRKREVAGDVWDVELAP